MKIEKDCCFTEDNNRFRYRAAGIIIEDNKILFAANDICDYFYTVGGGVHMSEKSEDCVKREVFEETGMNYDADRLVAVVENFFIGHLPNIDKMDCHTIEFYYLMKSKGIKSFDDKPKNQENYGERLVWIPMDSIDKYNIKPAFLKNRINEIIESKNILHIVTDIDRK